MPLTPETLPRHELAGLRVRVVESTDPGRVGIAGRVVRETAGTLLVETTSAAAAGESPRAQRAGTPSGVKQVPKRGTRFEFELTDATDEAAGVREDPGTASEPAESGGVADATERAVGDGAAYVTVDGDRLLSRPARRTETRGDTPWR